MDNDEDRVNVVDVGVCFCLVEFNAAKAKGVASTKLNIGDIEAESGSMVIFISLDTNAFTTKDGKVSI